MGEDGHWRLSPAYDMGYPHNPNGGWTAMHQMSIAGNFEKITKSDLLTFAKANNIKDANEVIEKVVEETAKWHAIARECDVPSEMIDGIYPNIYILLFNISSLKKSLRASVFTGVLEISYASQALCIRAFPKIS
jgi:serine/threonine-protein kinase HipA